jgi:hypothetical protein
MGKIKQVRSFLLMVVLLICISIATSCVGGSESSIESTDNQREQQERKEAREKTKVGIWYSLWYDSLKRGSFWEDEGTGNKIYYRPLLPDGTFGKYDSADKKVMKFHLEQMAEAGIDFLIYDQTNGLDRKNSTGTPYIFNNALSMSREIRNWNNAGNRPIKYCSAIGMMAVLQDDLSIVEKEAKILYEQFVIQRWGGEDNHMFVDGKPLLVLMPLIEEKWEAYEGDKTYSNKFTIRYATGYGYGEEDQWGWVVPKTFVTEDVATIMPGWYKQPHFLPDMVYREQGKTYKKNWEILLSSPINPNFIVINSFNEYAEHTGVFTADTSLFPEDYPIERWINEEGVETPSLYWDMTKEYIAKYRNGQTN